jgi:hypothetical protein
MPPFVRKTRYEAFAEIPGNKTLTNDILGCLTR